MPKKKEGNSVSSTSNINNSLKSAQKSISKKTSKEELKQKLKDFQRTLDWVFEQPTFQTPTNKIALVTHISAYLEQLSNNISVTGTSSLRQEKKHSFASEGSVTDGTDSNLSEVNTTTDEELSHMFNSTFSKSPT